MFCEDVRWRPTKAEARFKWGFGSWRWVGEISVLDKRRLHQPAGDSEGVWVFVKVSARVFVLMDRGGVTLNRSWVD